MVLIQKLKRLRVSGVSLFMVGGVSVSLRDDIHRVCKQAIRGLAIGMAIKVPMNIIFAWIKQRSKRRQQKSTPTNTSRSSFAFPIERSDLIPLLRSAFDRDTGRFILFFSTWLGSHALLIRLLQRIRPRHDQQASNHGVAGFFSALSLALDTPGSRRVDISVYLLSRVATSAWKLGVETRWLPSVPFGEVLAFCVIAAIIQYTFVYEPELMRKQFFQWIDDLSKDPQGRLDKFLLNLRRQEHVRVPRGYEVVERSACNTDYYYESKIYPNDPDNLIPDAHKPYMATGDCDYFDRIEINSKQ